ncbi:hypothetical protein Ga0100231_005420 [Opitutaceae bacterium TAV4]|nr:hypothetical protein Ga0100231_005420 [Opitutaceae bacterium TAV4]RRK02436.1 hypothetical protein Ga0100230_004640 [Opitutaceae bacterium TAV3]
MSASDLARLRRVAAAWRKSTTPPANKPDCYTRGYVITFAGEVSGWTWKLLEPVTSWRPGCIAVPADDSPCFEAVGGNYQDGAARWEDTRIPALRAAMEKEPDVARVVAIRPRKDRFDRLQYWIETPFKTFPKFVIGETDADFTGTRLLHRCGVYENAENYWNEEALTV